MIGEISVWWSWVLLVVLALLFMGLVGAGWWLLRRRKRHEMRTEVAQELRDSVRGLGLGMVWQAPLFQADIFGIRGKVDEFELRAELWDKSGHDFIRVSVYFPRSIQQDLRIRLRNKKGLSNLWRIQEVTVDDERFDEMFRVYTRPNRVDSVTEILASALRRRLVSLGERVDDLKLGDRSLYVLIDGGVRPSMVAPLISDSLELARIYYERSLDQIPSGGGRNTQYEMAAEDVLGRESRGPLSTVALPAGSRGPLEEDDRSGHTTEKLVETAETLATDELDIYRRLGSSDTFGLSDSEASEISEASESGSSSSTAPSDEESKPS